MSGVLYLNENLFKRLITEIYETGILSKIIKTTSKEKKKKSQLILQWLFIKTGLGANLIDKNSTDDIKLMISNKKAVNKEKQKIQEYELLRKVRNGNKNFNIVVPTIRSDKNNNSGVSYKATYIQDEDLFYGKYKDIIKQMLVDENFKWKLLD